MKMNMKKITTIVLFVLLGATASFAQSPLGNGGKQLNAGFGFSNFGLPVYLGLDFGVHKDITIGPRLSYRSYNYRFNNNSYNQSLTVLSFNGNYHFDSLFELPSEWNIYAGLTMGYYLWSSAEFGGQASGIGLDGQVGVRYFLSDKFGLNLEFGGGTGTGGTFGITYLLK
jgi:outer membrane immunogenic protein